MVAGTPNRQRELGDSKGLIMKHAYSVRYASELGKIRLLRLRNPHGKKIWTGDYSPSSSQWYSPGIKKHFGNVQDPAEFFISFEDFLEHFNDTTICFFNSNPT
jgi:hypothetical protein